MEKFLNDPVAVGMGFFGLVLLVGSGFNKLQERWERKQREQQGQQGQHNNH